MAETSAKQLSKANAVQMEAQRQAEENRLNSAQVTKESRRVPRLCHEHRHLFGGGNQETQEERERKKKAQAQFLDMSEGMTAEAFLINWDVFQNLLLSPKAGVAASIKKILAEVLHPGTVLRHCIATLADPVFMTTGREVSGCLPHYPSDSPT